MFELLNDITGGSPIGTGASYTFDTFAAMTINMVMGIALVLSIIGIIMSGIKFMSSGGDIKAVDEAKKALSYSIIALVLTAGALSLRTIIINTLSRENTGGSLFEETSNTPEDRIVPRWEERFDQEFDVY